MKKIGKIFKGDTGIWIIFLLWSIISLTAVYSSIGYMALTKMNTTPTMAFLNHLLRVVLAYVAIIIVSNINYQAFSRLSVIGYVLTVALLIISFGGRWMHIPGLGQFQPSEIAKIVLIVFLARQLTMQQEKIRESMTFWKMMVYMLIVIVPIFFENLSTAIIIFMTCMAMMYYGGIKKGRILKTIGVAAVLGGILLGCAYYVFHSPLRETARETVLARAETWSNRVDHWLNPNKNALTQENIARMAVADGKLTGVGIGNTVHARLMSEANNDFIYAIIIEETGAITGIIIFILYTIFYIRCIKLARASKKKFGGLMIGGISTAIYMQAMIHISVCVGVLPVTGQTLPFISSGGTAYIFMGCGIGIIQSVAADTKRHKNTDDEKQETIAEEATETATEAKTK